MKVGATIAFGLGLPFAGCAMQNGADARALTIHESTAAIVIRCGDAHVLTYHKTEVPPPTGASALYRRSGFIHPLTAPGGDPVTGMHPRDHHHHLGLWHAWVKTQHRGRAVDFWNLGKGEGTVRYAATESLRRGAAGVGFTVTQHHVALATEARAEETVLTETFSIDVAVHPNGHYLVDYVAEQMNVTDAPLQLPAYRYGGGIAYRGPAHWQADNSAYLTSAGRGRADGHTTRARWCLLSGATEPAADDRPTSDSAAPDSSSAAVAILGDPRNHDAPQRQRIWPATANNGGAVFFNFVPTQETAWALEPGVPQTMRYRLVVANGTPTPAQVDRWFAEYARR